MLDETKNFYREDKTTDTMEQTQNSFEKGKRKWLQKKTLEKENTNLDVIFYWTTQEKIVSFQNRTCKSIFFTAKINLIVILHVVTQVVQRTWPRIHLKLLNLINLLASALSVSLKIKKFKKQKSDAKIAEEKLQCQFYEKSRFETWIPKKDWESRRADRSQSEPCETKKIEDKNKYLIVGTKGQSSPDYNARTYGISVWWRNLKCGDFITGGFDDSHSDLLFWRKFHQQFWILFS